MKLVAVLAPSAALDNFTFQLEAFGLEERDFMDYDPQLDNVIYTISYRDTEQLACYDLKKVLISESDAHVMEYFRSESATTAEASFLAFKQLDLANQVDFIVDGSDGDKFTQVLNEISNMPQPVLVDDEIQRLASQSPLNQSAKGNLSGSQNMAASGVKDQLMGSIKRQNEPQSLQDGGVNAQVQQGVEQDNYQDKDWDNDQVAQPADEHGNLQDANQIEQQQQLEYNITDNANTAQNNRSDLRNSEDDSSDSDPRTDNQVAEQSKQLQPSSLASDNVNWSANSATNNQQASLLSQINTLNNEISVLMRNQPNVQQEIVRINEELRLQNQQLLSILCSNNKSANQAPAMSVLSASMKQDQQLASTPIFRSTLPDLQQETQIVQRQRIAPKRTFYTFSNLPNPIPVEFVCKICLEPFLHPITLKCGHQFCNQCLNLAIDQLGSKCPQCAEEIENMPFIDYYLQQKVNKQINYTESSIIKGDFVMLINQEFGRVIDISKAHYDFSLHQFSADINQPLIEMARIQAQSGEIVKSELYNLIKFQPKYSRISTRFSINSYIFKAQQPKLLEYLEEEYQPEVKKFALLPQYSFLTDSREILQLDGFQNQQYRVINWQGQVSHVDSLDEYLAIDVDNDPIAQDIDCLCYACMQQANLAVKCECGHTFCISCAIKLIRNEMPCSYCGEQMKLTPEYDHVLYQPEISVDSTFLDVDFMVFADQKIQFIEQKLFTGGNFLYILKDLNNQRQIYSIDKIQELPFGSLVPALRPTAGDIVVQLSKQYKTLAYADGQNIIGAYRKAPMYKASYLIQNIRLVQKTDMTDKMCIQCKQIMRRPVEMRCGHFCCRTCAVISCLGKIGCFCCGEQIKFSECVAQQKQEVDIGTICMKRHSKTNTYGSLYGFVRQIDAKMKQVEVSFASANQRMRENDIVYVGEESLVVKSQPIMNQLCVVNSGDLKGVYGILINSMNREVMLEIGVKIVCKDCSMVQIVAGRRAE